MIDSTPPNPPKKRCKCELFVVYNCCTQSVIKWTWNTKVIKLLCRLQVIWGNQPANNKNSQNFNTGQYGYSNRKFGELGKPFKHWTFWTLNTLFSVQFSDHHLTTGHKSIIWTPDVFRWFLYKIPQVKK